MATRRSGLVETPRLSVQARALLLSFLRSPEPVVTAAALKNYASGVGNELTASGLLIEDGYEPSVLSDEGVPTEVSWSPAHQAYGYFDKRRGWISVGSDALRKYRVDIKALLRILLKPLGAPPAEPLTSRMPETLWEAGSVRLPHRTYRTSIWFCRCPSHPLVRADLEALALARPPERIRIVLTSAPSDLHPEIRMPRHVIIDLEDVFQDRNVLALSGEAMAGRLAVRRYDDFPLSVEADGRVVRLHGKEFRFSKGHRQAAIMSYLFERYREGQTTVSVASMSEDLGLPLGARVRDSFKGGRANIMSELLFERAGTCGFRLNNE
jgi:hypothetical protein